MSLKKQTANSVKWQVGVSFLQKFITMGGTVILARILNPEIFGLFALAFVAIAALSVFKSMGFDSALIRRKNDIEKAASTAFFIIPILGFILYFILSVSAPLIGNFLNNGEVAGVIKALGIIFVISCLGRVPITILEKNMRFKQISIIELSSAIIYTSVGVTLAILGWGVWSLVVAYILKTLNQTIFAFMASKWQPRFEFDKKIALEMFNFGKFLFLGGLVWFLKMNMDNLLVGKILGVTALGVYAVAFNVANFGATYFAGKVHRVIFPAFSKIQSDMYDLKQAFLKTTRITAIFAFPFCFGLFLLGGDMVRVVYGSKWIAVIPVLKILTFAGLLNTLPVAMGPLFNACGKSKVTFYFILTQVSLFFVFVIPAAKFYGAVGVGVAVTVSQLIAIIAFLPFAMKLISIKIKDIYISLQPGLISSLVMALGIILFKNIFILYQKGIFQNISYNFIILFCLAILMYLFSLSKVEKGFFREVKELVF